MRLTVLLVSAALVLTGCARAAPPAAAASAEFLAKNAKAPGVKVTASGLQYKVLTSGPADGVPPGPSDEVKVNYEGKLIDGTVFDSSYQRGEPAVLSVDRVIPAWTEALQLMKPGDTWMIYAPATLAYGDEGAGEGKIPGGAALIFKIELISVQR
jgi:peptidylprolyl isomerase/FKBP-type peptidyl-prolyl cis-trans isomerase FklB